MNVKLLPKSEVNILKAKDMAREQAQGLQLAQRVDGLRELAAKEEQQLELFRQATLSSIQEDIKREEEKLDKIRNEYRSVKQELESETTLTRSERKDLEKLKSSLENRDRELNDRANEISMDEIDVAVAKKQVDEVLASNKSESITIQNLKSQAEDDKFKAQQDRMTAQKVRESALLEKEEGERYLDMREQSLVARERAIDAQHAENEVVSRENAIEKVKIADQWEQLRRTAAKLKENRINV